MKQIDMCSFCDLLTYAERKYEIPYNKAHSMFVDADQCAGEIYVEDMQHELSDYRDKLDEDTIKVYEIIVAFAKENKVDDFFIEPKNWR